MLFRSFDVDLSKYTAYFIAAINHDMSVSSIIDPMTDVYKRQIQNGIGAGFIPSRLGAYQLAFHKVHPGSSQPWVRTDVYKRQARSLHGLTRTNIHNMVVGVTEGFRKDLEIQGVGYRLSLIHI